MDWLCDDIQHSPTTAPFSSIEMWWAFMIACTNPTSSHLAKLECILISSSNMMRGAGLPSLWLGWDLTDRRDQHILKCYLTNGMGRDSMGVFKGNPDTQPHFLLLNCGMLLKGTTRNSGLF